MADLTAGLCFILVLISTSMSLSNTKIIIVKILLQSSGYSSTISLTKVSLVKLV
ncbi:hypothetical protein [Vaccinia virus]|nr:hypothetical protein [Vaccinia virus]